MNRGQGNDKINDLKLLIMKANELRIGNLVTVNNPEYHPKLKGVILRVTSISLNSDDYSVGLEHINQKPNTYYEAYSQFVRFIEPIQLTEEWLLKFGANKYEFEHKENQYRIENMLFVIRENIFFDYGTGVKLQFVHQLQNLYFAINSEELTI